MHEGKKEHLVTVRMPSRLISELQKLKDINHFMDISDEIRHIVRKNCIRLDGNAARVIEEKRKEMIISDLSRILEELRENK